ncbi:hypothetical protein JTB14_018087 [Gonioctena quinquepunctata]|nr:hypothetical protein JTB14_018087 [Gonioctena quinquepunctata]
MEEEKLLNDYIIKCCKMHYGLTTIQTRKLAYEYAKSLSLKYPAKWEENKMAGKEWMYGFRRRNPELSLRKPENTSAARSFGFNKTSEFYTNLKTMLERHPLTADRIFNFDESGVPTVLATPKVLAPRCQKQVEQIVSAERGELVTFGGIISASGNTIPPLFVFPRVHYKDNFLERAPEGSLGAANKSNLEHVPYTQNVVEDLSAPTPHPSISDICQPSTSGTQDFLEVPRESTEQTINSPLITYDDELQRFNLDACEPDALNNSPIHQIVAPLKTVLTPEATRPYPTVVRSNKTKKGRRPGKSRIYTDTPEKKLIEEKHNEKQLKKLEQERRARAKQMKRSSADFNLKTKNKEAKNTESD